MNEIDSLRLDKWLWAARFFKTRALATAAIKAGHIKTKNEQGKRKTIKPSMEVKAGDFLDIQRGPFQFSIVVRGINAKRQSASLAQLLYEESNESVIQREKVATAIKNQPKNPYGGKKPDKYTLRKNRALKRGY